MSIWAASSVEQTPVIELVYWEVFEVEAPKQPNIYDRHFAGYNITEMEGRVSSKIISFDKETRIGTTRSGRRYQLIGDPGFHDEDTRYTLNQWLAFNRITSYNFVTDEYK